MPALGLPATKPPVMVVADRGLCFVCRGPRARPRCRRSEIWLMPKRDYYEILGVSQGGERAGPQVGVSAPGKGLPSRPQRRRQVVRGEVQGAERGLRGAEGPAEARGLRPVRPCGFRGHAGRGAHGFGPDFASSMSDIFDDLFGEFMGGRRGAASARAASAAPTCATIWRSRCRKPIAGKTAQIRVPTSVTCTTCTGTGAKTGTQPSDLPDLRSGRQGAGQPRASSRSSAPVRMPWPRRDHQRPLRQLHRLVAGSREERTLSVNIPAGIEDGTRIRLANEGEAGLRGGPPGDLYIFLSVRPHEFFQRDGADLYLPGADLDDDGCPRRPSTYHGRRTQTRVKVPEGTETGSQFRLRARACRYCGSRRWRYLHPDRGRDAQNLTTASVNCSKRSSETLAETSPQSAGFFTRVKEFFEGKAAD